MIVIVLLIVAIFVGLLALMTTSKVDENVEMYANLDVIPSSYSPPFVLPIEKTYISRGEYIKPPPSPYYKQKVNSTCFYSPENNVCEPGLYCNFNKCQPYPNAILW